MKGLDKRRAVFVYEAARLHAVALHCPVIPKPWSKREDDFKRQFIKLVSELCAGKGFPSFEEAHNSWVSEYLKMGWRYGKKYDPEKKTHPDLVPYDELGPKEQIKDKVFLQLARIAEYAIW